MENLYIYTVIISMFLIMVYSFSNEKDSLKKFIIITISSWILSFIPYINIGVLIFLIYKIFKQ
nr:MAG TPA: resistance to inhibitors of cholinesterase-like protein [Caudoviricetes sp.]